MNAHFIDLNIFYVNTQSTRNIVYIWPSGFRVPRIQATSKILTEGITAVDGSNARIIGTLDFYIWSTIPTIGIGQGLQQHSL